MVVVREPSLQAVIDALSLPGVMLGWRAIAAGDEQALLPEEAAALAASVTSVRRASGAARIVARSLLAQVGHAGCAVPKGKSGAPVWPSGIVGSLAHDARLAVAAVAQNCDFAALGIDVEPAELLPADLIDIVMTPRERDEINDDPCGGRLFFAAKEAVYKAVYPLDQTFLDHHDVEVSLARRRAVVRNGRIVELRFGISDHLLALAFLPAGKGAN